MPRYSDKDLAELLKNNPDAYIMEPGFSRGQMVEVSIVPSPEKRSKYGNRKVEIDGHTFDSIKEGRRYAHLKARLDAGEISHLVLQPRFDLVPNFTDSSGKKHRKAEYVADFRYHEDNRYIVEDVKSVATAKESTYRLKIKLFLYKYPHVTFREIL